MKLPCEKRIKQITSLSAYINELSVVLIKSSINKYMVQLFQSSFKKINWKRNVRIIRRVSEVCNQIKSYHE